MNSHRNVELISGNVSCNGVIVHMGSANQPCVCTTANVIFERDPKTGNLRLKGRDLQIVTFNGRLVPWKKIVKAEGDAKVSSCVIVSIDCPKDVFPLQIVDKPLLETWLKNIAKVGEKKYLVEGRITSGEEDFAYLPCDVPFEASGLGIVNSASAVVAFLLPSSDCSLKGMSMWETQLTPTSFGSFYFGPWGPPLKELPLVLVLPARLFIDLYAHINWTSAEHPDCVIEIEDIPTTTTTSHLLVRETQETSSAAPSTAVEMTVPPSVERAGRRTTTGAGAAGVTTTALKVSGKALFSSVCNKRVAETEGEEEEEEEQEEAPKRIISSTTYTPSPISPTSTPLPTAAATTAATATATVVQKRTRVKVRHIV